MNPDKQSGDPRKDQPDEDASEAEIAPEEEFDDATVVATHDDATVVVTHEEFSDRTVAVSTGDARSGSEPLHKTVVASGVQTDSGVPSGPVVDGVEIPPSLAKLLFKRPLDPKRRAPESPFPKKQSSLPRGGVRPDIPVIYGARPEELVPQNEGTDFARWIGPPPASYALDPVDRDTLPSTARVNRRFSRIAMYGGVGVIVVTLCGLWWIVGELF
ncbi:hypothetical protein [Leucobacter denitrificans]|uniref:Uncharacterized protein n=1 Tax=Leucobacter denitrificans TaxID=683042 RepID=A0A7G9S3A7_9MICO|nr:hypothetical protein [Leucobacter denitrificans]QNN62332.1 hypothetical protein H9L06_08635 [Leucobacter denitrificans]